MASSPSLSLYDVLGIDKAATADEVRRAYKQRALETHPDKQDPGATEEEKQSAEARFHKVSAAFEILGNADRRRAYDARSSGSRGTFSETLNRRMKDREEWAQKQKEQYQIRIEAMKEETKQKKEQIRAKEEEAKRHAEMVAQILQTLCDENPEWEARKKRAQLRKAELQAEMQAKANLASRPVPSRH